MTEILKFLHFDPLAPNTGPLPNIQSYFYLVPTLFYTVLTLKKVIWFTHAKIMLHELCKFFKIQKSQFSVWNILRGRIIWLFSGWISCRTGLVLNKNMLEYLVVGQCLALESQNAGISKFQFRTENRSRTSPGGFLDRIFSLKAINRDCL